MVPHSVLERSIIRENLNNYNDFKKHGLEGTKYQWIFRVMPTVSNNYMIIIHLKENRFFKSSLMSAEISVDADKDDVVSIIQSTLDRMLSTDHVQNILLNNNDKVSRNHLHSY